MADVQSGYDPVAYPIDRVQRLRAFSIALNVQHQTSAFRSQRLCSKFARTTKNYPEGQVPIRVATGQDGWRHASFGNLTSCGNVWICPRCSEAKSFGRRRQIDRAVDRWLTAGLPVYMLTLTVPHKRSDALASLFHAKQAAWRSVTGSRQFREMRASGSLIGYVAVTQIKYREVPWQLAGWHVHLHVLLFLSAPLSTSDENRANDDLTASWLNALDRVGHGSVHRKSSPGVGTDLRRITTNHGIGNYLSTIERYAPTDWGLLSGTSSSDLDALARFDDKSVLPMKLFEDFVVDQDGGKRFDLPRGGAVVFDGERYVTRVSGDPNTDVELPVARKHFPWFEFQLSVRHKNKTIFSRFNSGGKPSRARTMWNALATTASGYEDSDKNTDFAFGAGRDDFLISGKSWRAVVSKSESLQAELLVAAANGRDALIRLADDRGIEIESVGIFAGVRRTGNRSKSVH